SPAGGARGKMAAGKLPARVLELLFSYLELPELLSCSLVCRHWNRCLEADENSEVWRSVCQRLLSEEALSSDILCNLSSYKAKARALRHAWSSADCSRNVYIKRNGFTLHRNPIAQSTDGARAHIGFSEGRHAWEIWWEGPLGTVAVIGVLCPVNIKSLLEVLKREIRTALRRELETKQLGILGIGERIRVILDMEDKTLAFERGYEFLGVAFRGLPKACLYPAVSAVYGNTEVTMVYLGKPLDG
ncbi:hypothetical protein chiPu_0012356, partial [Chiloscyllium punctatum]|nr:hypothetical protein [Chiloscyllium punctatum]